MKKIAKGIDISRHQGNFDLARAVKEGQQFVVVKAAGGDDGLYVDSQFVNNYNKAKKLGIPVGCYFFSKAVTKADAVKEAQFLYEHCLKGRQFELPVYYDVEHKDQMALSRKDLTDIIITFCDYLEKKNFWVGIYASKAAFEGKMYDEKLIKYTHWVAQWSKECTYGKANGYADKCLGMWQFGGSTNLITSNQVAGVTCDQDYMYVDFPSIMKKAGLNGFARPVKPEPPKPVKPEPPKPVKPEPPKPQPPKFKFHKGDLVKVVGQYYATKDKNGNSIKVPSWVKLNKYKVAEEPQMVNGKERVLLAGIRSYVWAKDLDFAAMPASVSKGKMVKILKGAVYGGLTSARDQKVPESKMNVAYKVVKVQHNKGRKEALLEGLNSWIPVNSLRVVAASK